MEIEIESLHLLALAFVALVILIADHDGFAYIRGKKQLLNAAKVSRLHNLVWLGLIGMLATGLALLADEPDVLEESAFYVKMLMVLALFINGVAIGQLSKLSTITPFANLTKKQKLSLLLSGAISASCWIGAALLGFSL
jgi:hypothetical protein